MFIVSVINLPFYHSGFASLPSFGMESGSHLIMDSRAFCPVNPYRDIQRLKKILATDDDI